MQLKSFNLGRILILKPTKLKYSETLLLKEHHAQDF